MGALLEQRASLSSEPLIGKNLSSSMISRRSDLFAHSFLLVNGLLMFWISRRPWISYSIFTAHEATDELK